MMRMQRLLSLGVGAPLLLAGLTTGCVTHEHDRTVYVDKPVPVQVQAPVQASERVVVVNPQPARDPSPDVVVITEAPPRPRYEERPAPRRGYTWIDGYYRHNGRQYVWTPGHWERLPRENARWQPGRYERSGNGYIWIDGRWLD